MKAWESLRRRRGRRDAHRGRRASPCPRWRPGSARAPAIETFLVGSPMSGMWRWKSVRVRVQRAGGAGLLQLGRRRGGLPPVRAQRPDLPRRAHQRRDGLHHPHARRRPTTARSSRACPSSPPARSACRRRSRTSACPIVWTEAQARQPGAQGGDAPAAGQEQDGAEAGDASPRRASPRCARRRPRQAAVSWGALDE